MKAKYITLLVAGFLIISIAGFAGYDFWYDEKVRTTSGLNPTKPEPFDTTDNPDSYQFDVIVVGGEPEGVAAAVAAARNGAKTLLVEHRDGLGGLMTYGMLNYLDIARDKNGKNANAGIFAEWHEMVGGKIAFDIETAKKAFLVLVNNEPNITLALNTELKNIEMTGNRLEGLTLVNDQGTHHVVAKKFIDSTQDGDLAAMAGAPFFVGRQDIGIEENKMAVTPMIHLKNVSWEGIKEAIASEKFGKGYMNGNVAWGFGGLHYTYKPKEKNTRLRGLNIARNSDGTIIINALQIFGVNGLSEQSKQNALEKGKRETRHIVKYLRKEFPGFENAEIASFPSELYVRETRHFLAEYQLPITDVWENKDHWDSIGFGGYPVDVQATSIHDYGYVIADPIQYAIPFRSLVPLEVDGLLIASRSAGYSSLAAGSARVIPAGMTAAQAAGTAAAIAIENNISFRDMSKNKQLINELQETLKKQGANLYEFELDYAYEGKWFYPGITELLSWGLVAGSYDNNLHVKQDLKEISFVKQLATASQRISPDLHAIIDGQLQDLIKNMDKEALMKPKKAAEITLKILDGNLSATYGEPLQELQSRGLIDQSLQQHLDAGKVMTSAEGYYLLGQIVKKLEKEAGVNN